MDPIKNFNIFHLVFLHMNFELNHQVNYRRFNYFNYWIIIIKKNLH